MIDRQLALMPFAQVADMPLAEAALTYARAGFAVFPCWPGSKDTATRHGFYDATTDLDRVGFWWRRDPDANIGLRTGLRVDVLDIDAHATGTGYPMLQALRRSGLIDQWAHAVRSPSGGLHLYYPADPGRPQRSWSRGTSHVDLRAGGGYIITVPSRITIDGAARAYRPVGAARADAAPIDGDRIRDLLTPQRPPAPPRPVPLDASERVDRLRVWLSRAQEGNRNASLFWAACRMVELGASESDTLNQLSAAAESTGLEEREILATVRSAHRTGTSQPPSGPRGPGPRGVTGWGR
ncbi:bifunctional DNA primase/polymerase [Leucobacter allii]|uniref:Bifunctional DNA primase/polymerase n=1 Tax=Leucobacter allii TaxID=2932247 RepID=A0ABY4FIK7_9MICO|nr:bifunctional DNA primase/polymerase [Leucobacter allii]UOQ56385.1 bifunctional DNA primase/polymerase [Leucobacter allii]